VGSCRWVLILMYIEGTYFVIKINFVLIGYFCRSDGLTVTLSLPLLPHQMMTMTPARVVVLEKMVLEMTRTPGHTMGFAK
jgi:hypothetical protein